MTAAELIASLQSVPPDTAITVWIDGTRIEVQSVDTSIDGFFELNADFETLGD